MILTHVEVSILYVPEPVNDLDAAQKAAILYRCPPNPEEELPVNRLRVNHKLGTNVKPYYGGSMYILRRNCNKIQKSTVTEIAGVVQPIVRKIASVAFPQECACLSA